MRVNLMGLLTAQAETMVVKFRKVIAEVLLLSTSTALQVEMKKIFRNASF